MTAKQYDTLNNAALLRLAELAMARYPAFVQGRLSLLCRSENATFCYRREGQATRYACTGQITISVPTLRVSCTGWMRCAKAALKCLRRCQTEKGRGCKA